MQKTVPVVGPQVAPGSEQLQLASTVGFDVDVADIAEMMLTLSGQPMRRRKRRKVPAEVALTQQPFAVAGFVRSFMSHSTCELWHGAAMTDSPH